MVVAGVLASLLTREWSWAAGGVLVGLAMPFTLLVIMPTNHLLLHGAPSEADAASLVARWGRLHWVRSLLGPAGLLLLAARLRLD